MFFFHQSSLERPLRGRSKRRGVVHDFSRSMSLLIAVDTRGLPSCNRPNSFSVGVVIYTGRASGEVLWWRRLCCGKMPNRPVFTNMCDIHIPLHNPLHTSHTSTSTNDALFYPKALCPRAVVLVVRMEIKSPGLRRIYVEFSSGFGSLGVNRREQC